MKNKRTATDVVRSETTGALEVGRTAWGRGWNDLNQFYSRDNLALYFDAAPNHKQISVRTGLLNLISDTSDMG